MSTSVAPTATPETNRATTAEAAKVGEGLKFECMEGSAPLQIAYDAIKYYSGAVHCGSLLLESDIGGGSINIEPTVQWSSARPSALYSLIMIDPDADLANNGSWPDVTTPGPHAPVRHWVVANINGGDLVKGAKNASAVAGATVVSPFHGPSPPWGSHRYGQFLFEQKVRRRVGKRLGGS